uniref:Uncharacterized protein n=1 Tax=Vitis vinifera TaxID=29760 RepID=F6HBW6_VITVI
MVSARSVSHVLAATRIPEFRGCSDLGNIWPVYSSNLPVLSGYGASRSDVNYWYSPGRSRQLCESNLREDAAVNIVATTLACDQNSTSVSS